MIYTHGYQIKKQHKIAPPKHKNRQTVSFTRKLRHASGGLRLLTSVRVQTGFFS